MAFSYVNRSGNGSEKAFTFSFEGQDDGYIREEDLVVTVGGVLAPFSLLSSNTLELVDAPPIGEGNVLIRRIMPKDVPYADFKRGNNFGQEVLNNSFLQLLYVVHEILDGFFPEGYTVRDAVVFLEDVMLNADLYVDGKVEVTNSDSTIGNSVVNFEKGDERYKVPFDEAVVALQSADANLQNQLTGNVPLAASAFSPISWHDQVIQNSVTIPDDKNAWSFGPVMSVAQGVAVTLGEGSYWTIAEGSDISSNDLQNIDQGEL